MRAMVFDRYGEMRSLALNLCVAKAKRRARLSTIGSYPQSQQRS
jgi:hypothetical protein